MKGFFWRVFFGYWVVIALAGLSTMAIMTLTTSSKWSSSTYRDQLLDSNVQEIQKIDISRHPEKIDALFDRNPIFHGFYDVYVLDKNLYEIGNKNLPFLVRRFARKVNDAPLDAEVDSFDPRLSYRYIQAKDGEQYLVIGRLNLFILGELLLRPGARGVLVLTSIILSAILSYLLARFIVLPVTRLQHAGRLISRGDLSVRVSNDFDNRKDVLAELARDFDFMADRIDLLLKNQEQLITDVSHELRSPLARLQASTSLVRQKFGASTESDLNRIDKESELMSDLIGQILTYSRLTSNQEIHFEATDIVDLVETIVDDAQLEAREAKKTVRFIASNEHFLMQLNNSLISSAIENIIRNAIKYTKDGSEVTVNLNIINTKGQKPRSIVIDVMDQGQGVYEKDLERIFDPFFRVDESRNVESGGGGLGLAIAHRAVKIHQGKIYASNLGGGGLKVTLMIPVLQ